MNSVLITKIAKLSAQSVNLISSQIGGVVPQCIQRRLKVPELEWYGRKNYWPKYSMIKDNRRRMVLKEHGADKLRYTALKRNDILPLEVLRMAHKEIHSVPEDATQVRIQPRCCMTSRGRGTVFRWRMHRMTFRNLADYNKLAGIQRAMW